MIFFSTNVAGSSTLPVASVWNFSLLPHFANPGLSSPLHFFVSLLCFAYWKLFFFAFSQWLSIIELIWISLRLSVCKRYFFIFYISFDSCRPVQITFCFIHSPDDEGRPGLKMRCWLWVFYPLFCSPNPNTQKLHKRSRHIWKSLFFLFPLIELH